MSAIATTEQLAGSAAQTNPSSKRGRKVNQSTVQTASPTEQHVTTPVANPQNLIQMVTAGMDISVNIPEGATLPDILNTLNKVVQGIRTLTDASERLRPVVGRIILEIQKRKLYKPDYRNITEFIEKKVVAEMGMGRSTAFESLRIAKAFPSMAMAEMSRYGASKLALCAKVTDETEPNHLEVLHASLGKTVEQIKADQKEAAEAAGGATATVSITLHLSQTAKNRWVKLLKDTELEPAKLFIKMIEAYRSHPSERKVTAVA